MTRYEFRTTGFTKAHLRGARFVGWHTTGTLIEHWRCIDAGERARTRTHPGVDTVAHEFGLHDTAYRRELADTDRLIGDLLARCPSGALLVTADHGQIHLEHGDSGSTVCPKRARRSEAMAGDGRFRLLLRPEGRKRWPELLEAARFGVGERGWVWSRAERLLEEGLLGTGATGTIPEPHRRRRDCGARTSSCFVDPALPNEVQLRSGHGSLSPDEMPAPPALSRGRAGR